MNPYLKAYMEKEFDAGKEAERIIGWIRDWFAKNGPDSPAVIGLSGGKDSTLVAALCVKALGKDRVFGVLMPDHIQPDLQVAKDIAEWLQIPYAIVDIGAATDGLKKCLKEAVHLETGCTPADREFAQGTVMLTNIPPRIRMTTLYAVAQSMNGRVSNNGNRSEKHVGYCTIYGDMAGDFSAISAFTVTEVIAIGEYLGIPDRFIHKDPSDGLTGKTDEDNFGFTYEELDTYILTGVCEKDEVKKKIEERYQRNLFKQSPMAAYRKNDRE